MHPGAPAGRIQYMANAAPRLSTSDWREIGAIERLCGARLPRLSFMQSVAERVARHAGAESFCFSLLDPGSGFPAEVVSRLDDGVRRAWAAQVFRRTPLGDMGWLTRQPGRVQMAEQFVADPDDDPLFRQVLLPSGLRPMVGLSFADGGQGWAYLNLMRPAGARMFGREERRFLSAVAPMVTAAVRRHAAIELLTARPGTGDGVVTFAPDGAIEAANDAGQALMAGESGSYSVPLAVTLMGELLRRAIAEGVPLPIRALPVVDPAAGRRYRVRPELLRGRDGRSRGMVVIEPLRALDDDGVLIRLGLTPREAEVTAATIKGLSTKDSASVLRLSPHTVEHHLGNVFGKLEVGSRAELAALLLGN